MEPKIGTNAYLLHTMNPFRRPILVKFVTPNVLKTALVIWVCLFAAAAWSLRGHGLAGIGMAGGLACLWFAAIIVHIELLMRLYAITQNFKAQIDNYNREID